MTHPPQPDDLDAEDKAILKAVMDEVAEAKSRLFLARKRLDHPQDYAKDRTGFENGKLRTFTAKHACREDWEGDVVRRFRRPDGSGRLICKECGKTFHEHGWIETLEGGHIVCPGDWIITGIKGERYPCKPDVFAATYEAL